MRCPSALSADVCSPSSAAGAPGHRGPLGHHVGVPRGAQQAIQGHGRLHGGPADGHVPHLKEEQLLKELI